MQNTIETITNEQADKMLEMMLGVSRSQIAVQRGVRNRCMMLLMLDAGLRVGEMVQLLQSDLIVENEVVTALRVRKEISKGKVERLIPLSIRLKTAINEMQRHIWSKTDAHETNNAFFNLTSVFKITTRQVERIIAKYSMLAFGQTIHPHILRHTFATRLMATTSMRIVQQLLGHKNIQTTQIYTHPNDQDLKKAIETLEPGHKKIINGIEENL